MLTPSRTLLVGILSSLMYSPLSATAAPEFSSRLNLSYSTITERNMQALPAEQQSLLGLRSHGSYIGVKDSQPLNDKAMHWLYRLSFDIDVADGDTQSDADNQTNQDAFESRQLYFGIKGAAGILVAGRFDTPFRQIKRAVDYFDEHVGGLDQTFTVNDLRLGRSLMYISPSFFNLVLYVDVIGSDQPEISNGTSIAVAYDNGPMYLAFASDLDVKADGASATRLVAKYSLSRFTVGVLAEVSQDFNGDKTEGVFSSLQYEWPNWRIQAQYGISDILYREATTTSIGLDYTAYEQLRFYGFATENQGINPLAQTLEERAVGVGIEFNY